MPAPDSGLTAQTRAAVAELARAVAALRPLAEAGCPLRTVGGWPEPGRVEPGWAEPGAADPGRRLRRAGPRSRCAGDRSADGHGPAQAADRARDGPVRRCGDRGAGSRRTARAHLVAEPVARRLLRVARSHHGSSGQPQGV